MSKKNATEGIMIMLDEYETLFFLGRKKGSNVIVETFKGTSEMLFKMVANACVAGSIEAKKDQLPIQFELIKGGIEAGENIINESKE